MKRDDPNLELLVRFQETAGLDLQRVYAQGSDSSQVEIEAQVEQREGNGCRARPLDDNGGREPIFGNRAELRLAETRKRCWQIGASPILLKSHRRLQVGNGRKLPHRPPTLPSPSGGGRATSSVDDGRCRARPGHDPDEGHDAPADQRVDRDRHQ